MAATNVSFEMNEKLRDEMAELCEELGMDLDDAFNLFARKMVNEQEIPFEVTEKDLPVSETEEAVRKIIKWSAIVAAVAGICALLSALFKKDRRYR